MKLNHLTYLRINYGYGFQRNHGKFLVDEVEAFVLPRRPNFQFYVFCCKKFTEHRVPSEFFYYYWIF